MVLTWRRLACLCLVVSALGCAAPAAREAPAAEPGRAGASEPQGRKRITLAARGIPGTLNVAIDSAGLGSTPGLFETEQFLHAGLGVLDDQDRLRPRLSLDVPTVENGDWRLFPDGRMETRWKLRPGVTWHDGAPFTSRDLVFSVHMVQDKQVALTTGVMFGLIEGARAPDDHTFVVTWKEPYIRADLLFTSTENSRLLPIPAHLVEPTYREDPTSVTQLPVWSREFVGLGPFRLRELVEGAYLVAEANPAYFLGRPRIDEVEVRFLPDPTVIAAGVLAGSIDVAFRRSLFLEQALNVRDQWREGRVEVPVDPEWLALFPNLINPTPAALTNVQFRRALLHAIDRQEMVDTLQAGLAPVAHSIIGPNEPEYRFVESAIVRYEYDPERAARMLEELGYARGPADGGFRDSTGQRLSIELRTRQGSDHQEKGLFGVAGYWQRLGIGVETILFPAQRAVDREWRATRPAFEVGGGPGGVDALRRFHSSEVALPENRFRGENRSRYANVELDALLDRFYTTVPERQRMDVLGEVVQHLTREVVALGIFKSPFPWLIHNRVLNVGPRNPAWNAHEWDVR